MLLPNLPFFFFFFNDTATTEIYTLSLHDALPISPPDPLGDGHPLRQRLPERGAAGRARPVRRDAREPRVQDAPLRGRGMGTSSAAAAAPRQPTPVPSGDRKSTRLNSSHGYISYAVFCLKKKKKQLSHRLH